MALKFFMLAGEASGDAHASRLIEALTAQLWGAGVPPAGQSSGTPAGGTPALHKPRFIGMGGPKMAAAGMELAKDLEGMQVVGFWEVAKKYGFFRDVFYKLLDRVKQEKPDALICVDYPGFNLRFAKEVKKLGIPVLYYIVPQVWAWKPNRPKQMAEFVDRAFCIFDFEPPFFEKFGLKTQFVGHPLVDRETPNAKGLTLPPGPKTVAFLPGSRRSEYELLSEPMCSAFHLARAKGDVRGIMSVPSGLDWTLVGKTYEHFVNGTRKFARTQWMIDEPKSAVLISPRKESEPLMQSTNGIGHSALLPAAADFSVVKSGTSTLEAGLAGNPMCAVYIAGAISYPIARLLVNIPVFSLVNIVLGRYVVPEILQSDVTPARIAAEIERGLNDTQYRDRQKAALAELPKKLGGPGASARAAKGMIDFLKGK